MANKANLANSVLFAPISESDTELEVYTDDGALFPAAPFYLTLSPKNRWSRKINSEIVLVTDVDGDILTITRAQKGTTAKGFGFGDLVANGVYVEDLDEAVSEAVDEAVPLAVSAALQAMMPVGFVVTLGVSTNPNTLYGFGTWTRIQGRVVVGVSDSDGDFDLNDTGGAKTHAHALSSNGWALIDPDGSGNTLHVRQITGVPAWTRNVTQAGTVSSAAGATMTDGIELGGATDSGNSLQPYISKYVWERTA